MPTKEKAAEAWNATTPAISFETAGERRIPCQPLLSLRIR